MRPPRQPQPISGGGGMGGPVGPTIPRDENGLPLELPAVNPNRTRLSTPEEIALFKLRGREDLIVRAEDIADIDWEAKRQRLLKAGGPCARVAFQDEEDRRIARHKAGLPDRDLSTVLLVGGGIVVLAFLWTM